jgi:chromosome segregation ATPase
MTTIVKKPRTKTKEETEMDVTVVERLATIEQIVRQVLEEQKKQYEREIEMRQKIADLEKQITQMEKQVSFWQGAIAVIAFVWPAVLKMFF